MFWRRLAACALALPLWVASPGAAWSAPDPVLSLTVETWTLDNGLRVVVAPDPSTPTVAVALYYDVGSRNEVPGRSGFAHLFEHMMFQGSENVGKGDHFKHVLDNGGEMNGTTSADRTNYFQIVPSDRLELVLWLESDRMRSLDISSENFENQREVVKEERRLRVDNQPYVPAFLAFREFAFENWAYAHSTIGDMADLDAAELPDVQAFFDQWYAPGNAVLVIAGDVRPQDARRLVSRWFGDIPARDVPPQPEIVEPPQTEARITRFDDPLAKQPALLMGWHVPPAPHPDAQVVEVIAAMLGGGNSSRLYERLVRQDGLSLSVSVGTNGFRGPDMMSLQSTTRGADPEKVRAIVLEEIERLRTEGPTDDELEAARQTLIRSAVGSVEGNLRRALTIGRDALYFGDPTRVTGAVDRIRAVTKDDVRRVLDAWIVPTNSDAMYVFPAEATR